MASLKERMAAKNKLPSSSSPNVSDQNSAPDLPSASDPGMYGKESASTALPPIPALPLESLPSLPPLPVLPANISLAAKTNAAINDSKPVPTPSNAPSQFSDQDPSLPPTPASAPVKPALPEAGLDSPTPPASNFQTQTSSSDKEIQSLMRERLDLKSERTALQEKLKDTEQQLTQTANENDIIKATLKRQIEALEAEKAAMAVDLSSSKQLIGAAKSGDESLRAALEKANQHIEALEAEKAAMAVDLSSSKQLIGAAKSGDESLRAALEKANQHIEALKAQKLTGRAEMSDTVVALHARAISPVIVSSHATTALHSHENPQAASQALKFDLLKIHKVEVQSSATGFDVQRARTPIKTNSLRKMKHETDEQQSEVGFSSQSPSSASLRSLPSRAVGDIASKMYTSSQSIIDQKDAVQRHSNPSTSHVSTTSAEFTPLKVSFKEEDFQRHFHSSEKPEISTVSSPNGFVAPIPNSLGLFDRMKLQARLHLESKDTENADFPPSILTHTPSRLTTFMDANRGPVPGTRLQELSSLVERKLAVLGDFKESDTDRLVGLRTKSSAEMDPLQASELWQKARAEQRLLRTSQVSGSFEERWKNINAIRDSMFQSDQPEQKLPNSDAQVFQPNLVLSQKKDSSFRSSIGIPRSKLEHLQHQAFNDSAMKMSDLRQNFFQTSDYDRL